MHTAQLVKILSDTTQQNISECYGIFSEVQESRSIDQWIESLLHAMVVLRLFC